jgi:transcription elongation GreA/GreB family factor
VWQKPAAKQLLLYCRMEAIRLLAVFNTESRPLSVAFAKEESAEAASETILPARPISDRVNLVTEVGLKLLQDEMARAQQALEAANVLEDVNERRRQSAVPLRDMRYYAERVRTAQLMPAPTSNEVIAFGHTVTFERDDGRTQTFRIVGEDEANPSQASISHGSPVAIALIGKTVGDIVQLGQRELEILSIS